MPLLDHLKPAIRGEKLTCILAIASMLTACGGGGGGSGSGQDSATTTYTSAPSSAQPSTTPQSSTASNSTPDATSASATDNSSTSDTTAAVSASPSTTATIASPSRLLLSEVASNYYSNDVAWFEIYNPNNSAVNLSEYSLRSSYLDTSKSTISLTPMTFSLPAVSIPAKGYVVVASRVYDNLQNNAQIVYIDNGNATPYWNANGSLELVSNGATIDFVRFGASPAVPIDTASWAGSNVAGLPSGPTEYGRTIVRLASGGMTDTNSARDWSLVNFATPAGINDIAPGTIDSDGDGIPDSAKLPGGTYGGLDMYAMGARPGKRDLFIEVDYMKSADPGVTPRREALQKLVDAFAEHNVAVHIDSGNLYSNAFDPARFNLGGGNAVNFASCIDLTAASADTPRGCTSFYAYKSQNFDVRRKFVFHYAMFGSSLNPDGSGGSSGVAELDGGDLIVTLGNYGLTTTPGAGLNLLINLQAGTLMHELGHNLGLRHGGNEDINYKPNHYSVMNYMYQFAGLSETPDSIYAAERYYLANNMKGKTYCNLTENSPCSSNFKIGYSNGTGSDLDERNLMEWINIGRGAASGAYADWNNDGMLSGLAYARNINPQSGSDLAVLHDYDEWSNLAFAFSRYYAGANTGNAMSRQPRQPRSNPMNQNPRNKFTEHSLPTSLQSDIMQHARHEHGRGKP